MSQSILQQAREAGYQAGLQAAKDSESQTSQVEWDEIYSKGQDDERRNRPSRRMWYVLGLLTGLILHLLKVNGMM